MTGPPYVPAIGQGTAGSRAMRFSAAGEVWRSMPAGEPIFADWPGGYLSPSLYPPLYPLGGLIAVIEAINYLIVIRQKAGIYRSTAPCRGTVGPGLLPDDDVNRDQRVLLMGAAKRRSWAKRLFTPGMNDGEREERYTGWRRAVAGVLAAVQKADGGHDGEYCRFGARHPRGRRRPGGSEARRPGAKCGLRGVNLFSPLPSACVAEAVDTLLARPGLRIERIVSFGQASPPDFWYDQEEAEWVLLLAGAAQLRFADEDGPRMFVPGDFIEIAPHRRHRVEWTDPERPTVWLAASYRV
jgi:cupin 2 domain-containing protein